MLENVFNSVITTTSGGAATPLSFLVCTLGALVLGLLAALTHMYRSDYTKSFVVTLALLPVIVQVVIMMVNGNVGTGVAVAGAFSLVRFRSIQGSAKEIGSIFCAMALGLACGMGYLGVAEIFLLFYAAANILYMSLRFGEPHAAEKELRITIPETLDYSGLFDDLFKKYTTRNDLVRVRTTNMGSLYQLSYRIRLRNRNDEKEFLDEVRCRNGNLDIICGKVSTERAEL